MVTVIDGGKKKKATASKAKKPLSPWLKFVQKHMKTEAVQKLVFAKRMKAIAVLWAKDKSNPKNK